MRQRSARHPVASIIAQASGPFSRRLHIYSFRIAIMLYIFVYVEFDSNTGTDVDH